MIKMSKPKLVDIMKDVSQLNDYLLNSELKSKIAKIYLFGSYVKGEAIENSDVDVLIFTSDGADVEKILMDRVFDFQLAHNIPIEVITAGISELFPVHDYFLFNVIRYGLEVYSMDKTEIKKEAVRELLGLADEYLESAEEVIEGKRFRLAIDAAYNAAELSAKGLILLKQDDLPGSHGGVVNMLGQLYINTGEIPKDIGRSLNLGLKLRNEARYKSNVILTKDNVETVLILARTLLKLAKDKI